MEQEPIRRLTSSLRLSRRRRRAIARELETHLEETRRELELNGLSPALAAQESLARLGNPEEIAEGFQEAYAPRRRTRVLLAIGLAGSLLAGAYGGSLASATSAHKAPAPTHAAHHIKR